MRGKIITINFLLIFLSFSLSCNQHQNRKEPIVDNTVQLKTKNIDTNITKEDPNELVYVGIKNPAGEISFWEVSRQIVKNTNVTLAAKSNEASAVINLYEPNSWKETCELMTTFSNSKELETLVWSNFQEISKLKSRIENLEKKQSKSINNNP